MTAPLTSPVEVSLTAFITFLQAAVPELAQVLSEFPTPNLQLKFPSASVTHSDTPLFTNEMPYEQDVGIPVDSDHPLVTVVSIAGQWDYKIQLDLWSRSVPERDKLFQKFFAAFNSQINPMGLSLQLAGYYNLWSRYEIENFSHVDGEQASQRGEWRTKVSILVSLKQALEQSANVITKPIVNTLDVLDTN